MRMYVGWILEHWVLNTALNILMFDVRKYSAINVQRPMFSCETGTC